MLATVPYPATSAWQEAWKSTTVRRFLQAVAVASAAVAVGGAIWAVERHVLHLERRFAKSPVELMVRACGLAHFLIGWLFLFTSPRLRNMRAVGRLVAGTALGVLLCLLFAQFGGIRNPLLYIVFYGYFLLHEIRDEAQLFRAYERGPRPAAAESRRTAATEGLLQAVSRAVALVLMSLMAAGFVLYSAISGKHSAFEYVSAPVLSAGMALLLALAAWSVHRAVQAGRQAGGWSAVWDDYRPLWIVYGGILLVLLIGSPVGSLAVIVLIHVAAWLVFVRHQLGSRPQTPAGNLWNWLRGTPAGFCVLHLAVAVGLLVLMALRVHAWHSVSLISEYLSKQNFCYWALMHISMSYWSAR